MVLIGASESQSANAAALARILKQTDRIVRITFVIGLVNVALVGFLVTAGVIEAFEHL
jgi:hypothetical protein